MAQSDFYLTIYTSSFASGINLVPYIEEIKWSENDLDSPNSGRTLDGLMHRGKVASKVRADIKLRAIKASELVPILSVLRNEYFNMKTNMLPTGQVETLQMYNSTRTGGVLIITTDGVVKHKDVAFNIIQR